MLWPPGFWVKYCMSDVEQKHNKNHSATILKLAPPPKNNNEKKALVNLIKQKKMRKKKKKILLGKIQNVVMATAAPSGGDSPKLAHVGEKGRGRVATSGVF